MRIEIDRERCTGHGRCYSLAPGAFGCDDDGYVELLAPGELPESLVAQAQAGAANCPEGAISLQG